MDASTGTWLWASAFALALVLVLGVAARLVYLWTRRRPHAAAAIGSPGGDTPLPMTCASCRRGFPDGTVFCPFDATRLHHATKGAHALSGRGGRCPRCRRAFESGLRFCPMDAEALVPLQLHQATHPEGGVSIEINADDLVGGEGKICPVCATRYRLEAGYCGRDASQLVTVN